MDSYSDKLRDLAFRLEQDEWTFDNLLNVAKELRSLANRLNTEAHKAEVQRIRRET